MIFIVTFFIVAIITTTSIITIAIFIISSSAELPLHSSIKSSINTINIAIICDYHSHHCHFSPPTSSSPPTRSSGPSSTAWSRTTSSSSRDSGRNSYKRLPTRSSWSILVQTYVFSSFKLLGQIIQMKYHFPTK